MSDEPKDELDKIKKEMKRQKKNKLAVPEEFLDNAKSYEDKQMLVKILTEKEKQRVVLIVKGMLRDAVAKKDKK
jgi:flagellar motility protein MotE (MotC chaperone)